MKKIILAILFSIIVLHTYAQTASGTVLDEKGNPLIGVAIKALESKVGTTTDFDQVACSLG
jgi:hypothetical protein